ncbi:expressed unknown protein [Seminavis robusta]|uniref:Uncharacterized protein n=1 Tax=Seminavis robusta TaxID=568900 RepID=A0A9N8HGF4_9STRA|nr:expressed unknown protein [Seminavis robusta]|eukprot:Sro630_g178360.1 n/a (586) ;mRNA; r:44936-46769
MVSKPRPVDRSTVPSPKETNGALYERFVAMMNNREPPFFLPDKEMYMYIGQPISFRACTSILTKARPKSITIIPPQKAGRRLERIVSNINDPSKPTRGDPGIKLFDMSPKFLTIQCGYKPDHEGIAECRKNLLSLINRTTQGLVLWENAEGWDILKFGSKMNQILVGKSDSRLSLVCMENGLYWMSYLLATEAKALRLIRNLQEPTPTNLKMAFDKAALIGRTKYGTDVQGECFYPLADAIGRATLPIAIRVQRSYLVSTAPRVKKCPIAPAFATSRVTVLPAPAISDTSAALLNVLLTQRQKEFDAFKSFSVAVGFKIKRSTNLITGIFKLIGTMQKLFRDQSNLGWEELALIQEDRQQIMIDLLELAQTPAQAFPSTPPASSPLARRLKLLKLASASRATRFRASTRLLRAVDLGLIEQNATLQMFQDFCKKGQHMIRAFADEGYKKLCAVIQNSNKLADMLVGLAGQEEPSPAFLQTLELTMPKQPYLQKQLATYTKKVGSVIDVFYEKGCTALDAMSNNLGKLADLSLSLTDQYRTLSRQNSPAFRQTLEAFHLTLADQRKARQTFDKDWVVHARRIASHT